MVGRIECRGADTAAPCQRELCKAGLTDSATLLELRALLVKAKEEATKVQQERDQVRSGTGQDMDRTGEHGWFGWGYDSRTCWANE